MEETVNVGAHASVTRVELIEISRIKVPKAWQVRSLNQDHAKVLAESIRDAGLVQEIVVRQIGDDFEAVAGIHRIEAHKLLERTHILARILDCNDLNAEMANIAENLHRLQLDGPGYDAAMARWHDIYEEKHGRAKRGRPPKGEIGQTPANFVQVAVRETGKSPSHVKASVSRGKKLDPKVNVDKFLHPDLFQWIASWG